MKCPRCTFVTSNKKDICPRCEFDLRAKKRELSIPVLRPDAPLEHLLAEHRAQVNQAGKSPQTSYKHESKKEAGSFWKKLFAREGKEKVKPFEAPPAIAPQPPTSIKIADKVLPEISKPAAAAKDLSKPKPRVEVPVVRGVAVEELSDPLLSRLDALESEIASPQSAHEDDGLDFQLDGLTSVPTIVPAETRLGEASARTSASVVPAPAVSTPSAPPSAAADTDFQELLRALEEMGTEDGSEAGKTDNLFAHHVPEIDTGLEDIIHALDEIAPSSELDDIELFQNKLSDLASSMQQGVTEAKDAASSLSTGLESEDDLDSLFPGLDSEASPVDESQETDDETFTEADEVLTSSAEKDEVMPPEADFDSLVSELDELSALDSENDVAELVEEEVVDEAAPTNTVFAPTPIVSPEVINFDGHSDEEFHKTLDALIGEDVLNVEAVKVAKKAAPTPQSPPSLVTDDGMEISFEFDLEGGGEIETTEEAIHEAEEHDPILAELLSHYEVLEQNIEHRSIAPKGVSFSESEADRDTATDVTLPQAAMAEGIQRKAVPNARAQQLLEKLSFLSDDLLGELKNLLLTNASAAPQSLASSAPAQATPEAAYGTLDFEVAERFKEIVRDSKNSTSEDLEALQAELGEELAALESEGLSIYSEGKPSEPELQSSSTASEIPLSVDPLSELAHELDSELEALGTEGFSIFSSESSESPDAPANELNELTDELEHELEALEAEGFSVYEEQSTQEEAPAAEELDSLAEELDEELHALEAEGFTVYESDETPSEPQTNELTTLAETLDSEINALEAEGFSVYEEHPAESEEQVIQDDLGHLAEELDGELNALESEGFTVYHEPSAEMDNFSGYEPPHAEEFEAFSEESADPESEYLNAEAEGEVEPPSEEIHHLAEVLDEELASLEEEAPPTDQDFSNYESTFSAFESELSTELRTLETQIPEATEAATLTSAEESEGEPPVDASEDSLGLEGLMNANPQEADIEVEQSATEDLFPPDVRESFSTEGEHYRDDISSVETILEEEAEIEHEPSPNDEGSDFNEESSRTGQFLVQDLVRLVDLVAEERSEAEPSSAPKEAAPSPSASAHEEIDLADLARFFNVSDDVQDANSETDKKNEPLDGALSTGVFLASDLQKIIAETPTEAVVARPNVEVDLATWQAAYEEVRRADGGKEVELDIAELAPIHQCDALNVLFDLAEAELRDPNGVRHKVTSIPSTVKTDVENRSLQQALTTFEKEEKVLTKRRARPAKVIAAEERKSIQFVPAGIFRRGLAASVDLMLAVMTSSVCLWFTVLPERVKHMLVSGDAALGYSFLPYGFQLLGLSYLLWLLAATIFTSGWGQTFGAQLAGIETINADGKVPGLKQSMLRALSTTTAALPLGLGLLPVYGKTRRAVQDQMSNTYVRVKKP